MPTKWAFRGGIRMSKSEFLHTLEAALADFKEEERKEILYDYEEHFRIGEESGKEEAELIEELGNPNDIAEQYRTATQAGKEGISTKEERPAIVDIIAAVGLLFFNLIFILGPLLGIIGVLIGLFASAAALIISGIAVIIGVFVAPFFNEFIHMPYEISHVGLFFIGIGTTALGALFLIGMCYAAKFTYKAIVKYISWNIKIIKG